MVACISSIWTYTGLDYADATLFDASQYAFFGQDGVEVELGGLEDEENDAPVSGFGNDEYHLFDKDEVFLFKFMKYQIPLVWLLGYANFCDFYPLPLSSYLFI